MTTEMEKSHSWDDEVHVENERESEHANCRRTAARNLQCTF